MFYRKNLEGFIIQILKNGPLSTTKLIEKIKNIRPGTTKQGVYKVVKKLHKEDVLVIHNKIISLSIPWLQKTLDFVSVAQHNHVNENIVGGDFLSLADGERIVYHFKNPITTDQYWIHSLLLLFKVVDFRIPIIIYDPHYWFMFVRRESEMQFLNKFTKDKRLICVTVGGNTELDHKVKDFFENDLIKYNMKPELKYKNNHYINVLGDYIIDVHLDKNVSQKIDSFFKETKKFTDDKKIELQNIVLRKSKNKFVISRNKKRAEKLRKQFTKDFYISEPYKRYI